jgi:hypothetical protein
LKCEKCGYVSFDYNLKCPACDKDLSSVRNRIGLHQETPEHEFDQFFSGASGAYRGLEAQDKGEAELDLTGVGGEAELDLDAVGDEVEFSLDD